MVAGARAEDEFRRQAELLEDANVFVRNLDGTITYWTHGAERLYGWTNEEAVGRISTELIRTEFPRPLSEIEAALDRNGRWEGELVHTRKDGSRVVVASLWVLRRDAEGEAFEVFEVDNDVTAARKAEESEREQRELAETIAAASQALTQELDLGAVLETTLEYLEHLVPYDSACVMLLDEAGRLAVRATVGTRAGPTWRRWSGSRWR